MKITVNKNEYINAHGKSPAGYGMWFFVVKSESVRTVVHYTGRYIDCLKEAKKVCGRTGCNQIIVCS